MTKIVKKTAFLLGLFLFLVIGPVVALEGFLEEFPVTFQIEPPEIHDETMVSLKEFAPYFDVEVLEVEDRVLCIASGGFFLFSLGMDEVWVNGAEKKEIYPTPLKVNDHYLLPVYFLKDFFFSLYDRDIRPVEFFVVVEAKSSSLLECTLVLRNNTSQTMTFTFNTGQKYDIVVEDMSGRTIATWSRDKAFTQAMTTMHLEGKSSKAWVATLEIPRMRPGLYTVKASLTGRTMIHRNITTDPVEIFIR